MPGDRPAAAAVVDQRVARLLEHPLLVADDDLRGAQLEQSLEPVVAVDDAAVQVVEVGGREAAAVELDHRAQVRRDDRQDGQDHPVRARARTAERLDQAEPLDRLLASLAGAGPDLDVEGARQLLEVHPADDLADRLGAHPGPEHAAALGARAVALVEVAVLGLAERLHRLERLELVAQLAQLVLGALGLLLAAARARGGACRPWPPAGRRSSARPRGPRRPRAAGDRRSTRSVYSPTILRSRAVASLPPFSPAAHDDLAGRVEGDRLLGNAALELGQRRLGLLGRPRRSPRSAGALRLEVRLGPAELRVQLVLGRFSSARSSSSSAASALPALPPRPSASSSIAARARLRASSSTWVTMYSAK